MYYILTTVFAGHKAALEFRPHGPFWARKMILSTYSPHRIISRTPFRLCMSHGGCLQTNTCGLCTIGTRVYNVINWCICDEI